MFRLGSLFSGSGGFELAGMMNGVKPVWASEIEPYPIRVTKARFPQMKHLGSVLDVNGAEVEPVDIITFGSPCQDLSVAGKQAGLHKGERSNLFFEAIRIIKEMRESTDGIYPRIAVWENVPGAYSSNKGEDFRAVLQAFVRLREQAADVPMPKGNKWATAGCVVGNGYSIAWRTLDAQYNGVPQRRRRIYLIADFGSERAGEVLLEQESVRGHSAESGKAWQSAAGDAEGSVGRGVLFEPMSALEENWAESSVKNALRAGASKSSHAVCYAVRTANTSANGIGVSEELSHTLDAAGSVDSVAYSVDCRNMAPTKEHGTLQAKENGGQSLNYMGAACYRKTAHPRNADEAQGWEETDKADTLNVFDNSENRTPTAIVYSAGNGQTNQPLLQEQCRTLDCMHDQQIVLHPSKPPRRYIVRRLTPLECCRLQGFPDWWEDGVQGSDSARYKMWGNGIALPNAEYVIGCAKKLIEGE